MTEFVTTNDVIIGKNVKETAADPTADEARSAGGAVEPQINVEKKKKKRRPFGIIRAALSMLRKRSGEKEVKKTITKQKSVASNANWTKLVGAMRPMCLQETPQSPKAPLSAAESIEGSIPSASASASPFPSPASCSTLSHYTSASSLRDLYNSSDEEEEEDEEEERDPDEVFDAISGDEMIDAKAEEFIAQFYKQIQLQNNAAARGYRDPGI